MGFADRTSIPAYCRADHTGAIVRKTGILRVCRVAVEIAEEAFETVSLAIREIARPAHIPVLLFSQ